MFDFNDRNLVIVAITVMVIVYIFCGKEPAQVGDIIEKAIIALGSLTTGSILAGSRKTEKLAKKVLNKKDKSE